MTLFFKKPTSDPPSMTPEGRPVEFSFEAHADKENNKRKPSHMRATFSIADEDFAFSPPEGGSAKNVFFPDATSEMPTPSSSRINGPKKTKIVPTSSAALKRHGLLKINAELQGYDANGNKTDDLRKRSFTIKLDQVSMALGMSGDAARDQADLTDMDPVTAALRLVSKSLGVTQKQISDILGVSTDTVRRVLSGKKSDKLRAALIRVFKAQPSPCPHCGEPRSPCPHCGQ